MDIGELCRNFFNIAEGVNCLWGIGNIFLTFWNILTVKNKKKFLEELGKEREKSKAENQKACQLCKSTFEKRIKDLKEINKDLLTKIK